MSKSAFLLQTAGGAVLPRVDVWVALKSNNTGTTYKSAARTTTDGLYFHPAPGDTYTVYYSLPGLSVAPASTPPSVDWFATGDTAFSVPYVAGDDAALRSATTAPGGPYGPNLPGTGGGGQVATTATPAGVTAGKVWDWGGRVFNALAAAAAGDGATVDQTAITATLAAAAGGQAAFPGPKTYLFNAQLSSSLTGQDVGGTSRAGSVLKQANGSNLTQIVTADTTHVHYHDFTVDGNKANNATSQWGLTLFGNYSSVFNVRGLNTNYGAFRTYGTDGSSIAFSHSEGAGGPGSQGAISIDGGTTRLRVIGNRIESPAQMGIRQSDGQNNSLIAIIGNSVNLAGNIGIAGATSNSFTTTMGNLVSMGANLFHCMDHGALVDSASLGNMLSGGQHSTSIDTAQRISYVGNIGRGANQVGLSVYNTAGNGGTTTSGRDITVGCNVWSNPGQTPMDIDSTSYVIAIGNIGKNGGASGTRAAFDIHNFNPVMPHHILLLGNIGYDDNTVKLQAYGFRVGTIFGSVIAAHNDFRGNLTGAVSDSGSDTYMHGNAGYNPRGALTPPGVPATNVLFQNPFNVDCTVYLAGGTLTAIGIGGLPIAANWGTALTLAQAATGGTLGAATYAYRVAARNPAGHTVECAEVTIVVAAGTTNSITLTMPTGTGLRGVTGWDIYGRTSAGELLMAANWQLPTFVDTGAITPSGAMPGTDTTGNTATGITAAAAAGSVHSLRLLYGQAIKLTYTVAPTWTWFGD